MAEVGAGIAAAGGLKALFRNSSQLKSCDFGAAVWTAGILNMVRSYTVAGALDKQLATFVAIRAFGF